MAKVKDGEGPAPHRKGGAIKAKALKNYIDRIERVREEKAALTEDERNVFGEAKGDGFDPKIMRQCLALRKMEPGERAEDIGLLETYMGALGHGPLFEGERVVIEGDEDGKVVSLGHFDATDGRDGALTGT